MVFQVEAGAGSFYFDGRGSAGEVFGVFRSRLRKEMSRQASATVTTHHVHLFSVLLSAAEMDVARLCAEEKQVHKQSVP